MSACLQPIQIGVQEMLWTEYLEPQEAKHWKMWTQNTGIATRTQRPSLQHTGLDLLRQCESLAKPTHAEQTDSGAMSRNKGNIQSRKAG